MSGSTSWTPLFTNVTPTMQTMFNTIRVRAMGITDEQLQLELMEAMRYYFSESTAWRSSRTFTITPPQYTILLSNWRTGAEVLFPTFATWNDNPLSPVAEIGGYYATQISTPQVCSYNASKVFTLGPQPNAAAPLMIRAALQPSVLAPVVPDNELTENFEGIIETVLARLYEQPGKPWSNNALALMHMKKSRAWISKARDKANRGFGKADAPWRFPYFARGSGANLWGWGNGIWTNN
jgi:hypothetical protein